MNPALDAWKKGDLVQAEQLFKEGLEKTGGDGNILLNYGKFLKSQNRIDEARVTLGLAESKLPLKAFKQRARSEQESLAVGNTQPPPPVFDLAHGKSEIQLPENTWIEYDGLKFRSQTETRIYEAFKKKNVLYGLNLIEFYDAEQC